jgi:hypothetical protein
MDPITRIERFNGIFLNAERGGFQCIFLYVNLFKEFIPSFEQNFI